jgi:hypothetical protein
LEDRIARVKEFLVNVQPTAARRWLWRSGESRFWSSMLKSRR